MGFTEDRLCNKGVSLIINAVCINTSSRIQIKESFNVLELLWLRSASMGTPWTEKQFENIGYTQKAYS